MISSRIVARAFVGRVEELDHLIARRRQAGDGHGGLVLIGGEAGIGKSRLVTEFKVQLNRRKSALAAGSCREFAQKPLGPVLDVLGQLTGARAPNLASETKDERLEALAHAFRDVAAKRTTVVILEDLHWADLDLVQTLLVLTQRAAAERLLFVATYRDNEIVPGHRLFKWFGRLMRENATSHITLRRFDDRDVDRLIASAIEGTIPMPPRVLHAVRERSDGNPLFAEELLRNAVDSQRGGLEFGAAALPLSLHALVAERLQTCTDDARMLLRRASLFGRHFSIVDVCETFGGEPRSLQTALEDLCGLQLLDAVDVSAGRYRFRHALTRDVVYGEMEPDTLRPLHVTIAQHLERSGEGASAPEITGHHFWQAGLHERAAAYYELAGDAAIGDFAYGDAAEFYERAGEGFAGDRAACARLFARAAQALMFSGDVDAGLDRYERAARLALELHDIAGLVRNRVLMAGHLFDADRRQDAIALLRETLQIAERGDVSLHSRLRTRLAMTLARDGSLDQAWEVLDAIDPALLQTRAEWVGEYYLCASELHALRAEISEWKACFDRGAAIYEELGHPGPLHVAHANFAVQALCLGETALAREHHRIAAEFARTLHFDDQAALAAQVELFAGNLSEARRIVDEMLPSSRFLMRALSAQVAIPLAIALGDDRMLERYVDEKLLAQAGSQRLTATQARVAAAHALAFAATNRRGEARMLASRVLASMNTAFGMMLPVLAVALLLPQRAHELRPLLEAAAEPKDDRVGKGLLRFLNAAEAAHRGDGDAARRPAETGAALFAAIGWPIFEARCLEMAGKRSAALEIYRRCGAAGELRRLEFVSQSLPETNALGVLTPRERELAVRVASGKSNREIAQELTVGEKTVEKYLTSIYAKLGLVSRAQLAALVASVRDNRE